MIVYQVQKQHIIDPILGAYDTYGIAVCHAEEPDRPPLLFIPDVFLEEEEAARFVARCNKLSLDPSHLQEVLHDTLGIVPLKRKELKT